MKPHRLYLIGLNALFIIGSAQQCWAQDYPEKAVRIVHPFPGGPVDGSLRALADRLATKWHQPVIVDPRPGASEIIAGDIVAKASPDGYTLFVGSDSNFTTNQFLFRKLPFDPSRDLVPVTQLYDVPFGLIVRGSLGTESLRQFVALMKERPTFNYASTGVGGSIQLAMESLKSAAGFEMTQIAYKQASQIVQDLIGGSVDAVTASAQIAVPYIHDGKMKVLAVSGSKRLKVLPDVPTFSEAGYPSVDIKGFFGLAVPKGTPDPIIQKLSADIREIIMSKDFSEKILDPNGYEPVASSPAQFTATLASKRIERGRQIKQLGIKLE